MMKWKWLGLALVLAFVLGCTGMVAAADKTIFSDGLEEIDPETKAPAGWVIFSNTNGDFGTVATDIVRSGKQSWFMNDASSTGSMGLRSPKVPAEAGKIYLASVYTYVLSGTANMYIEFWDENGTRLSPTSTKNNDKNVWEEIFITMQAPAGAKYVSVILYAQQVNVGAHYFDDVTIIEID